MARSEAERPDFPPLLTGEATDGEPLAVAAARARAGCEAGLVVHRVRPDRLDAAVVFAPEQPLAHAMGAVLAVANGFADAFGALAPSEIAAQFDWPGVIRINGGRCGALRAAADTRDPDAVPGWLVVSLHLAVFDSGDGPEPGETPDRTTLWEEGCADIEPMALLESVSRHMLVRINDLVDEGLRRNHADWVGRAYAMGGQNTIRLPGRSETGTLTGLDEFGGALLQSDDAARLIPLTEMLEDA